MFYYMTKPTSTRKPLTFGHSLQLWQLISWASRWKFVLMGLHQLASEWCYYCRFAFSHLIRVRIPRYSALWAALHRGEAGWKRGNSRGHSWVLPFLPELTCSSLPHPMATLPLASMGIQIPVPPPYLPAALTTAEPHLLGYKSISGSQSQ